jgi:sugar-specific transcriptional regulator TrmB
MTVEKILDQFGLTKNKGLVYLTLLGIGTGPVHEIARRSRLPRTTVHEILQQLAIMGLVSFAAKGRTRMYTVEPPSKLKTLLKDKERLLESALPELNSMFSVKGIRPRVRFYEGVEGIKTVFEDTLTVKSKELSGILSMEDLYKVPGKDFMKSYTEQRVKAGIKLRVVRSEVKEVEETWPSSAKENRELHYATDGMVFPMTIYLYDNKVGIIGTQKENFGMIIESPDFFLTQKNLFEVMWQVTRVGKRVD